MNTLQLTVAEANENKCLIRRDSSTFHIMFKHFVKQYTRTVFLEHYHRLIDGYDNVSLRRNFSEYAWNIFRWTLFKQNTNKLKINKNVNQFSYHAQMHSCIF